MLTPCGPKRGADRRRRRGLARRNLQLHLCSNFLCHIVTLYDPYSTCRKSSSTGVARPKMVTRTRSVLRSGLISSTLPEKFAKGPSMILHRLVLLERHLRARPLGRSRLAVQNRIHFVGGERDGLVAAADESGDARRVLHFMPQLIVHFHLHQHVSGIEQALAGDLLAAAQFHHFFGGNQNLADLVGEAKSLGAAPQRIRHLLLETRIGVDDVPVLVVVRFGGDQAGACRFGARSVTSAGSSARVRLGRRSSDSGPLVRFASLSSASLRRNDLVVAHVSSPTW